jgi:hypothetical protein
MPGSSEFAARTLPFERILEGKLVACFVEAASAGILEMKAAQTASRLASRKAGSAGPASRWRR